MRKTSIILLFLAAATLLGSCIKEDRSDCRRSFTLLFRYTGDGTTDIFREKVAQVHLYVYDATTRALVRQETMDAARLEQLQGIRFELEDLEPGNYEAVCWGNAAQATDIDQPEQRETATVAAPEHRNGQEADTNDELYYAGGTFTVANAYADQQDILDFSCAHIDLSVRLEGFDNMVLTRADGQAATACPVGVRLDGLPAYADFDGTAHAEATAAYALQPAPVADGTPDAYETALHTLRFADDTPGALRLVNPATGATVYTLPLADFLSANSLTVEDRQEVAVSILLHLNDDGVSVSVTPFEDEPIHPGLDEK